ncbi:MAG TPA: R3H domain-containing nucleic acid-binding protein [Thermoanaerobaculia bacterium]|nr:R3H domain-containing nucleic acid-binding protein [Thermoanaerobaculia bacterium]
MSQRFEGRNLEEALQQASQTLGVERWQMTYHVLLEKRGFLGGMKRVVIEADVNEAAAPPPAASAAVSAPASGPILETIPSAPPARRESRDRGGRSRGGNGGGGGGGERRGGGNRRPRRHDDELQPGDFEAAFNVEIPEQGAESDAAKTVRLWCENVINLADLDLTVRTEENETQIILRLFGRDAARLTDRHGELLDAIQVLANKALTGRKVEKEIELDTQQFKDRRAEELGQRAREIADRVRRDKREELLPAMTPIERRIVHMALREDADVTTESRGEGFYKRVAIVLRSAAGSQES